LILRRPTCCTSSQHPRTSSLFGSSPGRTKHPTIGNRNDLTGILVCRRSDSFTETPPGASLATATTSSPLGLTSSAHCARQNFGSPSRVRTRQTEHSRMLTESLRTLDRTFSGKSTGLFGRPPNISGYSRNSRVPPNTSGCSSNASGRSSADHSSHGRAPVAHSTTCGS